MTEIIYKKCTKCWIEKPAINEFYAFSKKWKFWFRSVCKKCDKIYRMNNKDLIYAANKRREKRNKEHRMFMKKIYYLNNREDLIKKWSIRRKEKWYQKVHKLTQAFIKENNLRPNKCSICWKLNYIFSHHTDYNHWNLIVWCCQSCHELIHSWYIECPQPIDLLKLI